MGEADRRTLLYSSSSSQITSRYCYVQAAIRSPDYRIFASPSFRDEPPPPRTTYGVIAEEIVGRRRQASPPHDRDCRQEMTETTMRRILRDMTQEGGRRNREEGSYIERFPRQILRAWRMKRLDAKRRGRVQHGREGGRRNCTRFYFSPPSSMLWQLGCLHTSLPSPELFFVLLIRHLFHLCHSVCGGACTTVGVCMSVQESPIYL